MEQLKYKIGEFSRLGRVTVRTLRYYGEIGLLKPEIIDRQTGYRYYSARQLQKLLAIVQLTELEFSLAEIRDLYEEDTHFPDIRMMERKISDCERELERHRRLSSRTVLESYDNLGMYLVTVVAPEMARLGCECPEPGYCFTIEPAGEYREKNFEIEYCEKVVSAKKDSDIIRFKELPEVPQAICMKAYGPYERLRGHYLTLFAEIARMGYKISGAPRASYVDGCWNQEDPEKWLTIIQVPVCKD